MARFTLDKNRGFIFLSGPDAKRFLQGLITNDIDLLSANRCLYSALLTPQGRYLFDFFLIEFSDQILIDVTYDRMAELFTLLRKYRLRSEVGLECLGPPQSVACVFDADASQVLDLENSRGFVNSWNEGFVCVDPRMADLGCRTTLSPEELKDKGIREVPYDDYNAFRLSLGVPLSGEDLIPEKSIPLECNLDELNAIGWNKGCYIGQELTTRTKHRGLVRKRLMPVSIAGESVSPGTSLILEGQEVGAMRSSLGNLGMAMIRLEALDRMRAGSKLIAGSSVVSPIVPEWIGLSA